jgi:phosphatidylglycerophosphate synthase
VTDTAAWPPLDHARTSRLPNRDQPPRSHPRPRLNLEAAIGRIRDTIRAIMSEENVYTLRLWDWIFPGLFVPLRGRRWARIIPNALTYSRLITSIPVLWWILNLELEPAGVIASCTALAALVLLRLTDIFDGRAARDLDLVDARGCKLDPLADGILGFGMALVPAFVLPGLVGLGVVALFLLVILLRLVIDTAVMVVRVRESKKNVLPLANKWGKLKYNLDFGFLLILHAGIFFHFYAPWILAMALGLGVLLTPVTVFFGLKNFDAHLRRLKSGTEHSTAKGTAPT